MEVVIRWQRWLGSSSAVGHAPWPVGVTEIPTAPESSWNPGPQQSMALVSRGPPPARGSDSHSKDRRWGISTMSSGVVPLDPEALLVTQQGLNELSLGREPWASHFPVCRYLTAAGIGWLSINSSFCFQLESHYKLPLWIKLVLKKKQLP